MNPDSNSIYTSVKRILSTPVFRIFAEVLSHGATHLVFLFVVGAITAYLWMLNNRESITPHNLGLHIGWTSNKSKEIQNMYHGYKPKDSIDNIKVHILLNSSELNGKTRGKYNNGIIVEFDGKARARDIIDKSLKQLITSYRDSVIISLYCEPFFTSYDAIVKFDPLSESKYIYRDSILENGDTIVIGNPIVVKGIAPDSVVPHNINPNIKDGIVSISMFPADYQSFLHQKTRNYVYFYSNEIGFDNNTPYYYYYFNIPPAKNAEIASIDFQFSDLIVNKDFGMKYTKGKNLQFKYIFPEPDIVGNGRVEYTSEEKKNAIRRNQGVIIQAVDVDALNHQNKIAFLYSVLIGTGFAFLIDILIQLIRELRRMQKREVIEYNETTKWFAYLRRHKANVFDVFFKNKENISDRNLVSTIEGVSQFFGLPIPVLHDKCETIAKVMTSSKASECELYYNCQLMEKIGINNRDTLTLTFVHELAHELLFNVRFMLIENELWIQELAADMIVGAFSTIGPDVATGKYKYVLRQLPASLTHPDGMLRAAIVEYGREYITKLREQQKEVNNIQEVLKGLPAFVYEHYQELQESWDDIQLEDKQEDSPVETLPINYESLPDTNLLKQYYMKYKKDKEDDI